jgi:hypothetical protein
MTRRILLMVAIVSNALNIAARAHARCLPPVMGPQFAALRRKRVGRVWDWSPAKSFPAIGITTAA